MSKKSQPKWTLVEGSDWTGLYKDGELICEDHDVSLETFAHHAGIPIDYIWADKCLEIRGRCPKDLSDVYPDDHDD